MSSSVNHSTSVVDRLARAGDQASGATLPKKEQHAVPENLTLTSPLLGRFEQLGILKVPFYLTPDEEALVLKIVGHAKLPTGLPLYAILCFDFYEQIFCFGNLIAREKWENLLEEFKREAWALQIQESESRAPEAFISLIEGLSRVCLAALAEKYDGQMISEVSKGLIQKKNEDLKHILETLTPRVKLLGRFLKQTEACDLLLNQPLSLYVGCEEIEGALYLKTAKPFLQMDQYVKFVFDSACLIDSSLTGLEEKIKGLREYIVSFSNAVSVMSDEMMEPFDALFKEIEGTSPLLAQTIERMRDGCLAHIEKLSEISQLSYSPEKNVEAMSGQIRWTADLLPQDESSDMLANLKLEGKVSPSFHLTPEEQNLLNHLFETYPLDSHLCLLDLLSFALYQRLGELKAMIPLAAEPLLAEIQGKIGAHCIMLFCGIARLSSGSIQSIGAPTDFTNQYHLVPDGFVERIDGELTKLPSLISPPRDKKHYARFESKQQALIEKIASSITPLKNLWSKILQSPDWEPLLLGAIASYKGGEKMDEHHPHAKDVVRQYWAFFKNSYVAGQKNKFFAIDYPIRDFNPLLTLDRPPSRNEMNKFRLAARERVTEFGDLKLQMVDLLLAAASGTYTHQDWLKENHIRPNSQKSKEEFVEQQHSLFALVAFIGQYIFDFLRLAEERLFPLETLTTLSSFHRLNHSLCMLIAADLTEDEGSTADEIEAIVTPITAYFKSPPFQDFIEFFQHDLEIKEGHFDYATWLQHLSPFEGDVQALFDGTIQALPLLQRQLLSNLRKDFSGFTLDELRTINPEAFREAIFNKSLSLLRPILILADILALLQKRHFSERAAMIPPELANVMELDGIETLVEELIRAKTPSEPVVPDSKKEEKTASPPPEIAPKPAASQPKPKAKQQPLPVAPMVTPPSGSELEARELASLTKSRDVLKKLESLGFFSVQGRGKGSHTWVANASGAGFPVPHHDELAPGTRNAISKEYLEATTRKPRDPNNNNN